MLSRLNRLVIRSLGRVRSRLVSSSLPFYRVLAVVDQADRVGSCSVRGYPLKLSIEDYCDYAVFKRWGDDERETLDWIDGFEPDAILLDVGSSIGRFSLYAATRFRDHLRVYAVDPDLRASHRLARNVALNGLGGQVTGLVLAASSADADVDVVFDYRSQQAHVGSVSAPPSGVTCSYVVAARTIDTLVGSALIRPPSYIKIDVDGYEVEVLEGAKRTLGSGVVRSLLVEVSPPTKDAVVRLLEAHGQRLRRTVPIVPTAYEHLIFVGDPTASERAGEPAGRERTPV